jgi:1-acyl-sn-glycerol-3-phosphate acyltransferase
MNLDGFRRASQVVSHTYRHLSASESSLLSLTEQKRLWALDVLSLVKVRRKIIGEPLQDGPALIVGNHISYSDIPLLLSAAPHVSFVAKQELGKWPIFGWGARRLDTIFVERGNSAARRAVKDTLKEALLVHGKSIAVFPAGTTSIDERYPWKFGSFHLAQETKVPLQVFRISYTPLREIAYIDNDFFPAHLARACSRSDGYLATLEFAKPVLITDVEADSRRWQEWSRGSDANSGNIFHGHN